MNRTLICVDLSNQVYKASAAHPMLSSGDEFTGGLYGFMMAIAKAIDECDATSVVLCTDSKPYKRSLVYPEYKLLRADTKDPELAERATTSIAQIRELMKVMGWPIWSIPGFESDDLIAHATIYYRHRYNKIIAMSNDSDLYQLFEWKHFGLYKGKKGLYTHEDYDAEWGLPAKKLVEALSMTGTHNEVEGIHGIGPATARKLITGDPAKYRTVREKNLELIKRNESVIKLPHPDFPVGENIPPYSCKYNERALQRFCARYEIQLQRWQSENFERINKNGN